MFTDIFDSGNVNESGTVENSLGGSGGMNGNSLIAALAGDATQIGTGFIAANVANNAVKKNPNSATTLILVVGGVAALVVVLLLIKR